MTDHPPAAAPTSRSERRRKLGRQRALGILDRIPTGWFASILTAAFLAVTAAFGGLAAVASPPVAQLEAGETHENALFALTVERAVLIDALPEAGLSVDDDQRVLAVVVTVENHWDRAVPANVDGGLAGSVRLAGLGDVAPTSIARFDDSTTSPYLQPSVPAQLVLAWAVDAAATDASEPLEVELRDLSLYTGALITDGESWGDPVVAARMSLDVTDVGAGASSEEAS